MNWNKWNCGRNKSFPNHLLFTLGWAGSTLTSTRMDLLNPTLGKDASHLCLISTWPKKECTIVCMITWASLKNCMSTHAYYALLRVHQPMKGEGGGFLLNPKRRLFVGGTNTHTMVHSSLSQVLIWQEWEASLPDVGLSKFVWWE